MLPWTNPHFVPPWQAPTNSYWPPWHLIVSIPQQNGVPSGAEQGWLGLIALQVLSRDSILIGPAVIKLIASRVIKINMNKKIIVERWIGILGIYREIRCASSCFKHWCPRRPILCHGWLSCHPSFRPTGCWPLHLDETSIESRTP